jgi:hypothetical protein
MRPLALFGLLGLAALLSAGCIDVKDGDGLADDAGPCIPVLEPDVGSMQAQWTKPASVGAQERDWQPTPFYWADAEHLARLDSIEVALDWANNPQGAADFGIALGRDGAFHYWNQAYQAGFGTQHETLTLDRGVLAENGWTSGDHLDAGPSVSTGAYSATSPISYTLSWVAQFQPPPEGQACAPGETPPATASATPQAQGRQA